jgi:hypothetical protein
MKTVQTTAVDADKRSDWRGAGLFQMSKII